MPERRIDPRIAQTRLLVLDAAADLLVVEGFSKITIESVAEKCGVARSTIYRNWGTRARLLVEAFERLLGPIETEDTGSIRSDLVALGRRYAHGLETEAWGEVFPSLVGAVHDENDLREALGSFVAGRLAVVSAVFDRAMSRGEVSAELDVAEAAELFAAPFFFRRLVSQQSIDDEFVHRHVDRVVASIAATT